MTAIVIKVLVAIVRKPGMSSAEFHDYWRTTHARLVRESAAAKRYMRRYVQTHALPSEPAPAFDGFAELWFDSIEDKDRFFSDPDYLANVRPDESRFADMGRTQFVVGVEETII